ncbi:hypothetical protein THASP1DRAFT_32102 [Thamnocephalis sphaerospora]|uniref:RGS domain-containing protein n=1 Tax=Thamnocephalis sphaerospora TaxID=78915 RepID=A0A4P9XJV1_9FUNG|nr:hypothetical protein THASP1DRAFT_32102 [Thamnocephalis sphaerospora]|eukprot:RKP06067.1 hypothetical protein THASP1DRAFT_32102 [Thamnocephalis sphaerospora]
MPPAPLLRWTERAGIYFGVTCVWSLFLVTSTVFFYRWRRHPAIQHREVAFTIISGAANAVFTAHHLVQIPLEGWYPCLLRLWIPAIFLPLWIMTLLARLTRIIAVYRLSEARLHAVARSHRFSTVIAGGGDELDAMQLDAGRLGFVAEYCEPTAQAAYIEMDPDIAKAPNHRSLPLHPLHQDQREGPATALAESLSNQPPPAHWSYAHRRKLTTGALARMMVLSMLAIAMTTGVFQYVYRASFTLAEFRACDSSPAYFYLWAITGFYIVLLAPALLYASRGVHDAWGIRDELVLCELFGALAAVLYATFSLTGWDSSTVLPAAIWILVGTGFTHIWTVVRPTYLASCRGQVVWSRTCRRDTYAGVSGHHATSDHRADITGGSAVRHSTRAGYSKDQEYATNGRHDPAARPTAAIVDGGSWPSSAADCISHLASSTDASSVCAADASSGKTTHAVTLDDIFATPLLLEEFYAFCMHELNLENVLFYNAVLRLRRRVAGEVDLESWVAGGGRSQSQACTQRPVRKRSSTPVLGILGSLTSGARSSGSCGQAGDPKSSAVPCDGTSPKQRVQDALQKAALQSSCDHQPPALKMGTRTASTGSLPSPLFVAPPTQLLHTLRRPSTPSSPRRLLLSHAALVIQLRQIVDTYIRLGAPYEVCVSASARERLLCRVDRGMRSQCPRGDGHTDAESGRRELSIADLDEVTEEVRVLLEHHSLPRFQSWLDECKQNEQQQQTSRRWHFHFSWAYRASEPK